MTTKENESKGCEFGRINRMKVENVCIDVNEIGKKMDSIYRLLLTTLCSIIVGIMVFLFTKGIK